jgi:hypothetical protein
VNILFNRGDSGGAVGVIYNANDRACRYSPKSIACSIFHKQFMFAVLVHRRNPRLDVLEASRLALSD